ncbi:ATP-binding protein [Pontibacter harenae]|uniref:ATP-binding protein n=1 Tax=Pontibacter harenae TaxID=2894083 RepID=UPI001E453E41|nr:hypothetical protein [Pontibacter harenae]
MRVDFYTLSLNLIMNALKYRLLRRKPEISTRTTLVEGYTLLEMTYNGLGIKEEHQKRMFAMQQRIEKNNVGVFSGVGLGLVNCL